MDVDSGQRWDDFDDSHWKKILLELRRYAKIKCHLFRADVESDDVASEALTRVLHGSRQWNKEKYADIIDLLKGAVDSIFYSLRKSPDNKLRMRERKNYTNIDALDEYVASECENDEKTNYFEERLDELRLLVEGDDDLEELFLAIEDGCFSYNAITEKLEWGKKKLYNAIKRLKRRIERSQQ